MPSGRPLPVRGHHLLCVLGFRDLGYDQTFVANMARIARLMRSRPQTPLLLTNSPDSICGACPHLSPQGCDRDYGAAERMRKRDAATLRRLGLEPGAKMSVAAAYALVKERFTPQIMADEVCAGCEWQHYGYCAEGLMRLKKDNGDGTG